MIRRSTARCAAGVLATVFFLTAAGNACGQGGDRTPLAAEAGKPQAIAIAADTGEHDPRDYLKFSSKLTSDCMLHRAQLRSIANTHPTRAIRVVLVNYTGKTRSQGSSDKILPPRSQPQPLGCDGTSGLKRRWEIVSAEFTDSKP